MPSAVLFVLLYLITVILTNPLQPFSPAESQLPQIVSLGRFEGFKILPVGSQVPFGKKVAFDGFTKECWEAHHWMLVAAGSYSGVAF